MDVTVAQRTRTVVRAAPIACACAFAGAGAYLVTHDPSAGGSRYPSCVFHELTGLWCPGCGLTRGAHALLRGDVVGAVSMNVFTPLVVAAITLTWFGWLRRAWGRPIRPFAHRIPTWTGPALFVLVIAYGVVRNLPGFGALAP